MFGYRGKVIKLFKAMLGSRLGRRGPFFLSHLVTSRCNCRCPACLWRKQQAEEMNTGEVEKLYRDAPAAGFVANVIWGGEPLLRQDLPYLCRVSRFVGMGTVVITNGYYLPDRHGEVGPELDALIVSMDYARATGHDTYRGSPGLFNRAVEGIQLIRKNYPNIKVLLNCLLHRGNLNEAKEVVYLAKELKVSVYLSPAMEGVTLDEKISNRNSLVSKQDCRQVAKNILELKELGFPVNNSRRYLKEYLMDNREYRCRVPLVFLTVMSDGSVLNCFIPGAPRGNIRESSLPEITAGMDRNELLGMAQGCQRCTVPDVVETSYLWELSLEPLYRAFRVMYSP